MKAVLQRVGQSHVVVDQREVGRIGRGLLVLLGVGPDDQDADITWLAEKILNLRIFNDDQGKMNLSLLDIQGELLVVSQFTLYADCRKGRRPSFVDAAPPDVGERLYRQFTTFCRNKGLGVAEGVFGAHMHVHLENDGPVTILLDSKTDSKR